MGAEPGSSASDDETEDFLEDAKDMGAEPVVVEEEGHGVDHGVADAAGPQLSYRVTPADGKP